MGLAKAGEMGDDVQAKYKLVTAFAMGLWWAYPILFYFFELTHTFGVETEIWCYAILDVSKKLARLKGTNKGSWLKEAPEHEEEIHSTIVTTVPSCEQRDKFLIFCKTAWSSWS